MNPLEELRASYRPKRITTLFVGESAPHGGTFFYSQNSGLFREIKKAFQGNCHFLENFKHNGFYLDDLVLEPVNHLQDKDRQSLCRDAVSSFAARLRNYNPKAVVILLLSIKPMVLKAMHEAGLSCQTYCTPYPGFGNQRRFHKAMNGIVPNLPVFRGNQWKEYYS
jgi:hypothetical protein